MDQPNISKFSLSTEDTLRNAVRLARERLRQDPHLCQVPSGAKIEKYHDRIPLGDGVDETDFRVMVHQSIEMFKGLPDLLRKQCEGRFIIGPFMVDYDMQGLEQGFLSIDCIVMFEGRQA